MCAHAPLVCLLHERLRARPRPYAAPWRRRRGGPRARSLRVGPLLHVHTRLYVRRGMIRYLPVRVLPITWLPPKPAAPQPDQLTPYLLSLVCGRVRVLSLSLSLSTPMYLTVFI